MIRILFGNKKQAARWASANLENAVTVADDHFCNMFDRQGEPMKKPII